MGQDARGVKRGIPRLLRGMHRWLPQEDYEMLGSPHPDGHRRLDLQGALLTNAYASLVDIIILIQR